MGFFFNLTHLPLEPCICASLDMVSIASYIILSHVRTQDIIETNAELLPIRPLGTNFSEILIKIQYPFTRMHLKIASAKWRPFCPRGDDLMSFMKSTFPVLTEGPLKSSLLFFPACCNRSLIMSGVFHRKYGFLWVLLYVYWFGLKNYKNI